MLVRMRNARVKTVKEVVEMRIEKSSQAEIYVWHELLTLTL